jgi:hypothetical protein
MTRRELFKHFGFDAEVLPTFVEGTFEIEEPALTVIVKPWPARHKSDLDDRVYIVCPICHKEFIFGHWERHQGTKVCELDAKRYARTQRRLTNAD